MNHNLQKIKVFNNLKSALGEWVFFKYEHFLTQLAESESM